MKTIAHPTVLLRDAIQRFRQEKTLSRFLECIDISGRFSIGENVVPSLFVEISADTNDPSAVGPLAKTFEGWVARQRFVAEDELRWSLYPYASDLEYKEKIDKLSRKDVVAPSSEIGRAQKLAEAFISQATNQLFLDDEDRNRISDTNTAYAAFRPAYEVQEFLAQYFPQDQIDDPGAVIGRYIRKIFPSITISEPEIQWYPIEDLSTLNQSWIHSLVSQVAAFLVGLLNSLQDQSSDYADAALALNLLSKELAALSKNRRTRPRDSSEVMQKLKVICRSSQAMLSSLCRIQRWGDYEDERDVVMEVLSSMPWGHGRSLAGSRSPSMKEIFGGTGYSDFVSCVPWGVAAQIEEELNLFTGDGVASGTERLIQTWLVASRHHHNGQSPLSAADLPLSGLAFHHGISDLADEVRWDEWAGDLYCESGWHELTKKFGSDIYFLIGLLQKLHYEIITIATYYDPNSKGFAKDAFLRWRREVYMQLVAAAFNEGYDELANAFLSFSIFSQSLIGYSIAGWPKRELADLILRSKNRPGAAMVRRAIAVAAAVESGDEYALNKIWLSSFADENLSNAIASQHVGSSRRKIEASCQKFVGEECWMWLFPETKRYLVDAEVMYSRCHLEMGTDIRDLGTLTSGYCKALEAELVGRFKDVFKSPEFAEYKIEHHLGKQSPTLGTAVFLIEKFSKLKPEMQARIHASCLRAHEDTELVNWLRFFRDIRNKSAHPKKFDNSDFMTVRDRSMQIYRRLQAKLT